VLVPVVVVLVLVLSTACASDTPAISTSAGTEQPRLPARTAPGPTLARTTPTEPSTTSSTAAPPVVTAAATTTAIVSVPAPPMPAPTEPAPVAPAPAPLPTGAASVFVLGDSVLLGTTLGSPPPMVAALPGWTVTLDCEGSRRLTQGLGVLQARRAEIGRVVVIQLGNNYIPGEGGSFAGQIDQAMALLAGTDRVVWVTVGEALSGRAELNAEIRAAAARHPTIVVADWAALVAADPSLAPGDGLHLSNAGRVALSELVASAVGPAPG
jgi:hypothetical protein